MHGGLPCACPPAPARAYPARIGMAQVQGAQDTAEAVLRRPTVAWMDATALPTGRRYSARWAIASSRRASACRCRSMACGVPPTAGHGVGLADRPGRQRAPARLPRPSGGAVVPATAAPAARSARRGQPERDLERRSALCPARLHRPPQKRYSAGRTRTRAEILRVWMETAVAQDSM